MKKRNIPAVVFVAVSVFVSVSCVSRPEVAPVSASEETGQQAAVVVAPDRPLPGLSHSGLTDRDVGKVILVRGLITVGDDGTWCLSENPDSRSRVVFLLSDPRGLLVVRNIREGSIITIEGILTDASATWRKKIEIQDIKQ